MKEQSNVSTLPFLLLHFSCTYTTFYITYTYMTTRDWNEERRSRLSASALAACIKYYPSRSPGSNRPLFNKTRGNLISQQPQAQKMLTYTTPSLPLPPTVHTAQKKRPIKRPITKQISGCDLSFSGVFFFYGYIAFFLMSSKWMLYITFFLMQYIIHLYNILYSIIIQYMLMRCGKG